jgi:hypothetical protein
VSTSAALGRDNPCIAINGTRGVERDRLDNSAKVVETKRFAIHSQSTYFAKMKI